MEIVLATLEADCDLTGLVQNFDTMEISEVLWGFRFFGSSVRKNPTDRHVSFTPQSALRLLSKIVIIRVLVEPDGIEPTTSSMPLKRSPN